MIFYCFLCLRKVWFFSVASLGGDQSVLDALRPESISHAPFTNAGSIREMARTSPSRRLSMRWKRKRKRQVHVHMDCKLAIRFSGLYHITYQPTHASKPWRSRWCCGWKDGGNIIDLLLPPAFGCGQLGVGQTLRESLRARILACLLFQFAVIRLFIFALVFRN